MAVYTFFMLSGYLTNIDRETESGAIAFLIKRFIRLYPVFVVCMLITLIVRMCTGNMGDIGITDIILNFTMVPGLLSVSPVDGVYWTLQYELLFYFWIAVLIILRHHMRLRLDTIWVSWSVIAITVTLIDKQLDTSIINIINILFVFKYIQSFVLGMMLKRIADRNITKSTVVVVLLCIINQYLNFGYTGALWIIFASVFIIGLMRLNDSKYLNNIVVKALCKIAMVSYPLYLLHQVIGYIIIKNMQYVGLTSTWFVLVPIAVSILMAEIVHRLIETPINKLRHKLIK